MSVPRADTVRREIEGLVRLELDVWDYVNAAIEVVGRSVPFDATCWATVDPDTMLFTGQATVAFDPSPELEARFVDIEYGGRDPHSFAELARRAVGAARLSDAGPLQVLHSERRRDVYGPLGIRHEARMALTTDQRCWGVAGLLRGGGSDFSDAEVELLAALSPHLGRGLRDAVARDGGAPAPGDDPGPAVAVIGPAGEIVSATPAALEQLQALDPRPDRLAIVIRAMVASMPAGMGGVRTRVRDRRGAWTVLRAAPLTDAGGGGAVAVTIEPAGGPDLFELRLEALGLSARELDVCRQVLAGRATKEIAAALYLSPHTVQDHLKSIFDKIGVRSRRELVAAFGPGGPAA